jgi:hypothetical protein
LFLPALWLLPFAQEKKTALALPVKLNAGNENLDFYRSLRGGGASAVDLRNAQSYIQVLTRLSATKSITITI